MTCTTVNQLEGGLSLMPTKSLAVNELIMLLALDDEQGKVDWNVSPYLDYALAGGMLAELSLRKMIEVTPEGDLKLCSEKEGELSSGLLKEVYAHFSKSDHPNTVSGWVASVSTLSDLDHRQMEELVKKGILKKEKGHFLLIFPQTVYPTLDATPEKHVKKEIREVLLNGKECNTRLAVLISIARGAHLLQALMTQEEIARCSDRLDEVSGGEAISQATCDLISEAERALYVASSIPFMGISRM